MSNIRCPSCRQLISLTDPPRGQTVRCPACGVEFAAVDQGEIASGLPPATERTEEGIQTSGGRLRDRPYDEDDYNIDAGPSKWRWTALGLTLVWWGSLGFLVMTLAMGAVMIASPFDPRQPPQQIGPFVAVMMVGSCVVWIVVIMALVGMCMTCTAPDPSARRRAIASCATLVLSIAVYFVLIGVVMIKAFQDVQKQGGPPQQLDAAAMAENMKGPVLFMMVMMGLFIVLWNQFHVAVATHFRNAALRRLTLITLGIWLATLPLNAAFVYVDAAALGLDEPGKMRLQNSVGIIVALVTYSLYLLVCARTIATIREGMPVDDDARASSPN